MNESDDFTTQFAIRLPNGEMFLSPHSGAVVTWSVYDGAKHVYDQLAANAQAMGMEFGGTIVWRYCTRFISTADPAEELITELENYLRSQGGAS